MKRMSRGASAVSRPARSPFFTRAGPLRDVQRHAQLGGEDVGERGLAQARRAGEEHVVERLAALPGRLGVDPEVVDQLLLSDVLVEAWPAAATARAAPRPPGPFPERSRSRLYRHAGNVALVSDRLDGRFASFRAAALGRAAAGRRRAASRSAGAAGPRDRRPRAPGRWRSPSTTVVDLGRCLQPVVHPRAGRDVGLLHQRRPGPVPLHGRPRRSRTTSRCPATPAR